MTDPDGLGLMLLMALLGIGAVTAAGAVQWLVSRPSRRWIKRLRELDRARAAWNARMIADQCFYKQEK